MMPLVVYDALIVYDVLVVYDPPVVYDAPCFLICLGPFIQLLAWSNSLYPPQLCWWGKMGGIRMRIGGIRMRIAYQAMQKF